MNDEPLSRRSHLEIDLNVSKRTPSQLTPSVTDEGESPCSKQESEEKRREKPS
jgi:hypothetical protein